MMNENEILTIISLLTIFVAEVVIIALAFYHQ